MAEKKDPTPPERQSDDALALSMYHLLVRRVFYVRGWNRERIVKAYKERFPRQFTRNGKPLKTPQ